MNTAKQLGQDHVTHTIVPSQVHPRPSLKNQAIEDKAAFSVIFVALEIEVAQPD